MSESVRSRGRNFALFSLLAIFGLSATGCSLGSSSAPTAKTQQLVRVWRPNQAIDPLRSYIAHFQEKNPTTKVSYVDKTSPDTYELDSLRSMTALNGPDIWSIHADWIGDYSGQAQPLPSKFFWDANAKTGLSQVDAVKKFFPQGIVDQIIDPNNNVLGMPTNVDALHLFINSRVLSQANDEYSQGAGKTSSKADQIAVSTLLSSPPATWNDVVDMTKYVTKRDGTNISRSTIALGTADNVPEPLDTLQLLMLQNGARIISTDHKTALFHVTQQTPSGSDIRPGEKALSFYNSFTDPTKPNYSWNSTMPSALDAFGQGKLAIVIAYTDFEKQLNVKYPQLKFTKAPIPQIASATIQDPVNFIKFNIDMVTKTADSTNAAFLFLQGYSNQGGSDGLASEQGLRSPYMDNLKHSNDFISKAILSGQSVYKVNRVKFDAAFRQMIVDTSQNNIAASPALDNAADTINRLLISPTP